MAGVAAANPRHQFLDTDGNPLAGGFVYVYLAGTTTATDSWQDRAKTTANTNPVELDASGSCLLWLDSSLTYKFVVTDSAGVTQSHLGGDNIVGAAGASILADALADVEAARVDAVADVVAAQATAETAVDALVTEAETARDAALAATKIYATTTAGLAAVASGEYFYVPSTVAGESLILYKDDAGVAVEVSRYIDSDNFDGTYSPDLSGVAWGVKDDANKLAIYIDEAGQLFGDATPALSAFTKLTSGNLLDVVHSFVDDDNREGFHINRAGNFVHRMVEVDLSEVGTAVDVSLLNTTRIRCFGDSLTAGTTTGVTTPYPTALQALFTAASDTRTVDNHGISGMTSQQISSKYGAKPCLLTVTNNTIPTSGAVTVTATNNSNLSSKSNFGSLAYTGSLFGIPGTLSVGWNATTPEDAGTTTFTRTTSGTATLIPDNTPFIPDTSDWELDTLVVWAGRNDVFSGTSLYTDEDIIENIELMVDFMPKHTKRFVVLGVIDAEADSDTVKDRIIALNYKMVKKWPRNFIDIRKILVNSYDSGQPDDVTAFADNRIPPSLFQDGIHLNDAGYAIVADAVFDFINAKGW